MNIKPIKTMVDHQDAIKRPEAVFDVAPNTAEGDELEVLGVLIADFEKIHFPVAVPDPVEAVKFRMEQLGYPNQ